jgi:hypothetical protein
MEIGENFYEYFSRVLGNGVQINLKPINLYGINKTNIIRLRKFLKIQINYIYQLRVLSKSRSLLTRGISRDLVTTSM